MYVWAFGHIVLASDAAALSNPNGNALLGVNNPCGSNLAVGASAWGASPLVVVWRWAGMPTVPVRGATGSCATSYLARTAGRDEVEG